MIALPIALLSCSNTIVTENDDKKLEEATEITENVVEVYETSPKIEFEVKTIKRNSLQEGTHGDNSETELIVRIDGVKVDSFLEFGNALIKNDESGNPIAYYNSDLSQVTIASEVIDDKTVVLTKGLFSGEIEECMMTGGPIQIWTRTYTKSNDLWKMSTCKGDCK